jgi:hypothetical protein
LPICDIENAVLFQFFTLYLLKEGNEIAEEGYEYAGKHQSHTSESPGMEGRQYPPARTE